MAGWQKSRPVTVSYQNPEYFQPICRSSSKNSCELTIECANGRFHLAMAASRRGCQ
ncbi:hypothetical protein KCP78_00105 [Salmonella enterica subsp. enterica]|nr:hypothetical protein KCP78_00105 [Salmonella enterica subsp. enterica]